MFVDLMIEMDLDAHPFEPRDLGVEHVARQTILRDAETHHAAGHRARLVDRHVVAEQPQVIRCGESRRTRTDDQDALSGERRRGVEVPAALEREIAEKPFDGVDRDRLVELPAVARALARMITHAAHQRGERILLHERAPRGFVIAAFRVVEPALDVFARRADLIARRQAVEVHRPFGAPAARSCWRDSRPGSSVIAKGLFMSRSAALRQQAEIADVAIGDRLNRGDRLRVGVLAEEVARSASASLQILGQRAPGGADRNGP